MKKLKVLIALNNFKQNGSSLEFGNYLRSGILETNRTLAVDVVPLSDGGDGMLDLVSARLQGKFLKINCLDGYLNKKKSIVFYDSRSGAVFIELAKVIGFEKDKRGKYINSSSYGAGVLVKNLIVKGYREFVLGVGGLVSIDLGLGFLNALGLRTLDRQGHEFICNSGNLGNVNKIVDSDLKKYLTNNQIKFTLLCDAEAYITGPDGCWERTLQKGGSKQDKENTQANVLKVCNIIEKSTDTKIAYKKYLGCGGGFGGSLFAFANSKTMLGADYLMKLINMDESLRKADIAITGEGIVDGSTIIGKAPHRFMILAKKHKVPTLLIASQSKLNLNRILNVGFSGFIRTEVSEQSNFPYSKKEARRYILSVGQNMGAIISSIIRNHKDRKIAIHKNIV